MEPRKKFFFSSGIIFLFLFLLSCQPAEKPPEAENLTPEQINETILPTEGPCLPGWKCLGKWDKAYQYSNCSWSEKIRCPLTCENGTCLAGKTCPSGFKCIDETKRGYQLETCTWTKVKKCDWGCQEGKCQSQPENYTEEAVNETEEALEEETIPEEPQEEIKTLSLGEKQTIPVNGEEYNLSIYNLEADQVKIQLDNWKSDWLREGDNYTYGVGVTISIKEILFQAYPGGKKSVGYIVR